MLDILHTRARTALIYSQPIVELQQVKNRIITIIKKPNKNNGAILAQGSRISSSPCTSAADSLKRYPVRGALDLHGQQTRHFSDSPPTSHRHVSTCGI